MGSRRFIHPAGWTGGRPLPGPTTQTRDSPSVRGESHQTSWREGRPRRRRGGGVWGAGEAVTSEPRSGRSWLSQGVRGEHERSCPTVARARGRCDWRDLSSGIPQLATNRRRPTSLGDVACRLEMKRKHVYAFHVHRVYAVCAHMPCTRLAWCGGGQCAEVKRAGERAEVSCWAHGARARGTAGESKLFGGVGWRGTA